MGVERVIASNESSVDALGTRDCGVFILRCGGLRRWDVQGIERK